MQCNPKPSGHPWPLKEKAKEMEKPSQEEILKRLQADRGLGPNSPVPLDMNVLSKEDCGSFERWKIEYTAEAEPTALVSGMQKISAYLLIPVRALSGDPLPGAICFHQCNVDCIFAKEAVVGNIPSRTDQRYGIELVERGFVVLAPDSINCGERRIPKMRREGENKQCFPAIETCLGRQFWNKHICDGVRAIDLLESLPFVDSDRLAAVGHSMGSADTFLTMAYDTRIKAGIMSGGPEEWAHYYLPLIAPRFLITLHGEQDGGTEYINRMAVVYQEAACYYTDMGAPVRLVLRIHPGGHEFPQGYRLAALDELRAYLCSGN
jgi:dienelactone hydrolase